MTSNVRPAEAPRPYRAAAHPPEVQPAAWLAERRTTLLAMCVFFVSAIYYGACIYPGVGGEINAGDSAKFQILGHAQIMVHGPGYPLYLMVAALLRALDLPIASWWLVSFALSAIPAAIANAFAFLIVRRITGSLVYGAAAALVAGSATLMAIQATEAEVYALNIAFVLAVTYLLLRFVETARVALFVAAAAVYALSFGNHLMMVMLLPVFVVLTAVHYRRILRPAPVTLVALFVLAGASQYLYIFALSYDPATAYSEYMALPPTPGDVVRYIGGTYFADLHGRGLDSGRNLQTLVETLDRAHPWLSAPLIAAGAAIAAAGLGRAAARRDPAWRGLALVFAVALAFLPFVNWYGAWDIKAFHLPVLIPLLIGAVAAVGWAARARRRLFAGLAAVLVALGLVRAADMGTALAGREPNTRAFLATTATLATLAPGPDPIIALDYDRAMRTLYFRLAGVLPWDTDFRLFWQLPDDIDRRTEISGIALPRVATVFVDKVRARRPDLACRTRELVRPPALDETPVAFRCAARIRMGPRAS